MIVANKCPLCDETIPPDSSFHICSSSDAEPVSGPVLGHLRVGVPRAG